jgi:hypothetical protein
MTMHLTKEQGKALLSKPKRSKYGAKRTLLDGITFDSKAEAAYYSALKLREKAGEVYEVQMQPPYALTVNGLLVCVYKPDFVFYDAVLKRTRIIDVKGVRTKEFIIKQKLMRACHGIEIEVVA